MQLQDNMTKVLDMNARLVESVEDLTSKNELLAAQVASLTTELSSSKHNVPSTQPTQPTQRAPNLLIGASTIRDIACTDPKRLYVVSRGGSKSGDILKILKEMKPNSYEDITIHVGTNDCTTRYPVDKICANFKEMATQAKRVSKTGHVSFSSITLSVDDLSAAAKGAEVNEGMKRVAEESGCQYICNQDNFLCRNGDINMELVAVDGLHHSKLGTERLIENLKLNDTACCRIGRSQRPGLDPQEKHSRPWRGTEPAAPGGHHRTGQRASHQASSNRPAATQYQASKSRTRPPGGKGPVHYGRNSSSHTRTNDISYQNIQSNGFCHFCGKSNHLRHVCRYGMPVTCFRCHRTGHKEKFGELYAWSDGEEGGPDLKPPYMYKDFIVSKASYPYHDESNHYRTTYKFKQTPLLFDNDHFWNSFEVVECPKDGHCFIHAVVVSYNSTVNSDKHIDEMNLLNLIKSHTMMKPQLYTPYIEEESVDILFSKMRKYVFDKCYKSVFGDIVVLIAATVLNTVISIIETENNILSKIKVKNPNNDDLNNVYVLKTAEHYDAIVCKNCLDNDVTLVEKKRVTAVTSPPGNPPDFCNFTDIRMHNGRAQVMLHDPSFTDKNVTQSSNLLNYHVTINFCDFIDIHEYLDDACEMFTR